MWRKWFIVIGLICISLVAAIVFFAKPLIHNFAFTAFSDAGCRVTKIEGIHLRFEKVMVDSLYCEFEREDVGFIADAKTVGIVFPWEDLLTGKQNSAVPISKLEIGAVRLEFPKNRVILPPLSVDINFDIEESNSIELKLGLQASEVDRPIYVSESKDLAVTLKATTELNMKIILSKERNLEDILLLDTGTLQFGLDLEGREHMALLSFSESSLKGDSLASTVTLNAINSYAPILPIRIKGDVGKGDFQIKAEGELTALTGANLKEYEQFLPEVMELDSTVPNVSMDITIKGNEILKGKGNFVFRQMRLQISGSDLQSGEVDMKFHLRKRNKSLATRANLEIKAASFDSGFSLNNISLALSLPEFVGAPKKIKLTNASAELFHGTLAIAPKTLDLRKKFQSLTVKFRELNLAEILKLDTKGRVKGYGTLDGEVPILVTEEGIAIDNGKINARSPGGVIQYKDEASTAVGGSNENLNLALKALENFQFSRLDSGVIYEPDGRLVFALHLQGKNPNLYEGKPFHFNINVEQNLLQLLKSLQITDAVDQSIDRKFSK